MTISVGDVFSYPGTEAPGTAAGGGGWHIHIVLKIDESGGDAYVVPLSSVSYDWTCKIEVSDGCPLVTKPCVVAYYHGKKIRLERLREIGLFRGPAPKELVATVIAGVGTSSRSPDWLKDAICPPPPRRGKILLAINRDGA
jgi:hypothetical protein